MAPSQTQAQRAEARDLRQREAREQREASAAQRAEEQRLEGMAIRAQQVDAPTANMSKKEQRKANREAKRKPISFQQESLKEASQRVLGVTSVEVTHPESAKAIAQLPKAGDSQWAEGSGVRGAARSSDADTSSSSSSSIGSSDKGDKGMSCHNANCYNACGRAGRVVMNHSTHCEGLLPVLVRLMKVPGVHTCTPGELSQTHSHYEQLSLRVQRAVDGNAFRLVACNGRTKQDVLVVVEKKLAEQEDAVTWLQTLVGKVMEGRGSGITGSRGEEVGAPRLASYAELSRQNRAVGQQLEEVRKAALKARHEQLQGKERQQKKEEAERAQETKLSRISRKDKARVPGLKNPAEI